MKRFALLSALTIAALYAIVFAQSASTLSMTLTQDGKSVTMTFTADQVYALNAFMAAQNSASVSSGNGLVYASPVDIILQHVGTLNGTLVQRYPKPGSTYDAAKVAAQTAADAKAAAATDAANGNIPIDGLISGRKVLIPLP